MYIGRVYMLGSVNVGEDVCVLGVVCIRGGGRYVFGEMPVRICLGGKGISGGKGTWLSRLLVQRFSIGS